MKKVYLKACNSISSMLYCSSGRKRQDITSNKKCLVEKKFLQCDREMCYIIKVAAKQGDKQRQREKSVMTRLCQQLPFEN
ncbi:MAG: hypothetical protein K0S39_6088 [Paenibacillus sp.]|jgi:hypothetical protein|nr:hypothetical protein [Paenibacillus sp.]